MHQVERLEYCGVSYLCSGTVSSYWWQGDNLGSKPGYMVIDLFDDGSFKNEYVEYAYPYPASK